MIDLERYRNKIVSYNPKLKMRKSKATFPMASASACFLLAIFLAVTITALAMEMDPSIEKKQGLSQSFKDSITPKEKNITQQIEKLKYRIAYNSSHRYFLQTCLDLNLNPKGYRFNSPIATASPSADLTTKHNNLAQAFISDIMKTVISLIMIAISRPI